VELAVRSGDLTLRGSLHLPRGSAAGTLLMHPGSGPSDRDNDVYFPPIRGHLLEAGVAVCSFDKRGVGGSTGRWQEAGIVEQADDLLACLAALLADASVPRPIGVFGHSQGGWVVLEAAGRNPPIAYVVGNAAPGVTPLEQERYANRTSLAAAGVGDIDNAAAPFEELADALQTGATYEEAKLRIDPALTLFPEDEEIWRFLLRMFDYDPRPALQRIRVPVLAMFGADDPLVPVEESISIYGELVRPELLDVAVFARADHRVQVSDPPRLADGYLETLTSFVLRAAGRD